MCNHNFLVGFFFHYGIFPDTERNFPVATYANHNGWRWDILRLLLPPTLCDRIAPIPPPKDTVDDVPLWKGLNDGSFSLKGSLHLSHKLV